ncbi:hypothetical protein AGR2A_Cc30134 [Agrobacterium genomosp. 2 str. CFBP 5494]|uniref:Uncharacterized protein n=1 Tax=Agrobacterium genomosp. 2 str. CFBP 5494 TaxID=1183436 RepID=A0A9W5B1D4_9HYPH|nr:hypothetical protein AGR2A_Cc30134 [Agrobacterium genomosp. 2 str. CFBP 5494]
MEFTLRAGIIASCCSKSANAILFFLHAIETRRKADALSRSAFHVLSDCSALDRFRVDPANIAVVTPVDDVEIFLARAAEQQNRFVGHVERHHGTGNRHGLNLFRTLGHNGGCVIFGDLVVLIGNSIHHRIGDFLRHAVRTIVMVLELALVATQALFDPLGGGIEARLRIIRLTRRMQYNARIEMQLAIGRKTRSGLLYGHLA